MPNFSGIWTLQAQMQAQGANNWQLPPSNLYAWGQNNVGQVGDLTTVNRSSPVNIGSGSNWSSVAGTKGTMAFALKSNGTLWSWGYNPNGQLGQNDRVDRSSPVQVGADTNWSTAAGGDYHATFIKTTGTLWLCGRNNYGQLGQNDLVYRSSPTQVGSLTTWSKSTAGQNNTVAIKTDGTLWSWGYNGYGELGQNNRIYRSSPVQVGALTTWSQVAAGGLHVIATQTDGSLWSWGLNNSGQLGQNIAYTVNRSSPVQIGALTTWLNVSCGYYHSIATKTDGTLWAWGYNNYGQLGDGTVISRSSPVQIGALTTWSKFSGGYNFTSTIKTDGTLWSWGRNNNGQLGQNIATTVSRSSPVQVGSNTNWVNTSSNSNTVLATTS
jgi:alpha-tubulin suppressor-like RCC1 family protein